MREEMTAMEQEILENVVKSEIEFVTYEDVATGDFRSIITNEGAAVVVPPVEGSEDRKAEHGSWITYTRRTGRSVRPGWIYRISGRNWRSRAVL